MSYKTLRGTRDLLPDDCARWRFVEGTTRALFERYGFGEIRTPIIESTELFVRSVGEGTDIVGKEMYTLDRGDDSITLRPENTAPVARAFVQHAMQREVASGFPVRLYYIGPMFRYERPQAGRQRQFHQIGAEVFGAPEAAVDAETLTMLERLLDALGIGERRLVLNSLGDPAERARYRETLRDWAAPRMPADAPELERVLRDNPLRLFDNKDPRAKEMMQDAPTLLSTLDGESRAHFDAVCAALGDAGVSYAIDERLVRGLDYYRRTVFEVTSSGLGAQNAILGGGRYDGLVESLGGGPTPGFGFAIGMERLISLIDESRIEAHGPDVAIVVLGEEGLVGGRAIAERLRGAGLGVALPTVARPMGAQLKRATRAGARHALFVGADELAADRYGVKQLESGEQVDVDGERLIEHLRRTP